MMYAIDLRYILNLNFSKISFSFYIMYPPNPQDTRYICIFINIDVDP